MNLWGWFIAAVLLLFVLWQIGNAVLFGRMGSSWFEAEDFLYFHDDPILFSIDFGLYTLVAGTIVYFGLREYRKHQIQKMDSTPRHTFDARKPRKDV